MLPADPPLLTAVVALARQAGAKILEIYHSDFTAERKDDGTPVTVADTAAEAIILPGLRALTPGIPAIGEESAAAGNDQPVDSDTFWLVDPLDGTREFVKRNDEFSVNIGLIENGVPALGVVHGPVSGITYAAHGPGTAVVTHGELSQARPVHQRTRDPAALTALVSRSHSVGDRLGAYLNTLPVGNRLPCGSALKFGLLADGQADFYPRFGPTSEWDTAAGHAVLLAVGGHLEAWQGEPWRYNKPGFKNPGFLAYLGDRPTPKSP